MKSFISSTICVGFFLIFCSFSVYAQNSDTIKLPQPKTSGGKPLLDALNDRHSSREFSNRNLSADTLSTLLWAADGYNRPSEKKRTAPSSMNYQEIIVYVSMASGVYKYNAEKNQLEPVLKEDIRALTGKQDFVKNAAINLIYIADYSKINKPLTDYQQKASYANSAFIAENVYLFCSSEGLATVIRASFDEVALSAKLKLGENQKIILCQTVGYPGK